MAAAFTIIFLITIETLPTVIRGRSFGVLSAGGRVGAFLGMQILKLGPFTYYYVFAGVSLFTAAVSASMFETFGKPLMQTVEQLEQQLTNNPSAVKTRKPS